MLYVIMFSLSVLLFSLLVFICETYVITKDFNDYLIKRQEIVDEELSMSFGANISLDKEEQHVNEILMRYKREEIIAAFADPGTFLPSKNFLRVSDKITNSRVFQIIRRMPKGGVLHAHISAINSRDFILRNITHRPNLYVCRKQDMLELRFLNKTRASSKRGCSWELLKTARKRDKSIDKEIEKALIMYIDEPLGIDESIDGAWKKFLSIFYFIKSLVTYRPVYEDFLYHILEELYEDNVQFIEVRTTFSKLYELNGYQHNHLQVLEIYKKVVNRFMKNHPDFLGVKWIYSPQRNSPDATFAKYIQTFKDLRHVHPDMVVGFDLVGQEDKGRPLRDFAEELRILGQETQFFFHAGETNWNGQKTDENLLDAVLLNTKRIGHGYALLKHPKLMDLVKKKNIAIEISPISNQVLKLVKDLRNHPASYFFAMNLPVVVSNDDPAFWGARALSYDFYEAFVGIMSTQADLRALKQLSLNSIEYSSFNDSEKQAAMKIWSKRWRGFIEEMINDF